MGGRTEEKYRGKYRGEVPRNKYRGTKGRGKYRGEVPRRKREKERERERKREKEREGDNMTPESRFRDSEPPSAGVLNVAANRHRSHIMSIARGRSAVLGLGSGCQVFAVSGYMFLVNVLLCPFFPFPLSLYFLCPFPPFRARCFLSFLFFSSSLFFPFPFCHVRLFPVFPFPFPPFMFPLPFLYVSVLPCSSLSPGFPVISLPMSLT